MTRTRWRCSTAIKDGPPRVEVLPRNPFDRRGPHDGKHVGFLYHAPPLRVSCAKRQLQHRIRRRANLRLRALVTHRRKCSTRRRTWCCAVAGRHSLNRRLGGAEGCTPACRLESRAPTAALAHHLERLRRGSWTKSRCAWPTAPALESSVTSARSSSTLVRGRPPCARTHGRFARANQPAR